MTAPASPTIRVRVNGLAVRVLWQAVPTATDYAVHVGDTAAPSGIEAELDESDVGADGWCQYTFVPDDSDSFINVTALNALAEESDPSNEVTIRLR